VAFEVAHVVVDEGSQGPGDADAVGTGSARMSSQANSGRAPGTTLPRRAPPATWWHGGCTDAPAVGLLSVRLRCQFATVYPVAASCRQKMPLQPSASLAAASPPLNAKFAEESMLREDMRLHQTCFGARGLGRDRDSPHPGNRENSGLHVNNRRPTFVSNDAILEDDTDLPLDQRQHDCTGYVALRTAALTVNCQAPKVAFDFKGTSST